jgi:hypothetical protein
MGLILKKATNENFAWLPTKKISDLFMSHTQVQACKILDNSVGEKKSADFYITTVNREKVIADHFH